MVTVLARAIRAAVNPNEPAMPDLDQVETPDVIAWDRHPVDQTVVAMRDLDQVETAVVRHMVPSTVLRKVVAKSVRHHIVRNTDATLDLDMMEIAAALTSVRQCTVPIIATLLDMMTAKDLHTAISHGAATTRVRRIATSSVTRITSVATIAGRHLDIMTSVPRPIGVTRTTASVRRFIEMTIAATTIVDQILVIMDHGTAIVAKPA